MKILIDNNNNKVQYGAIDNLKIQDINKLICNKHINTTDILTNKSLNTYINDLKKP